MFTASALAEGSAELDAGDTGGMGSLAHDQALDDQAVFYVDILDGSNEKICWTGTGSLTVYQPNGSTVVDTINGTGMAAGRCTNAASGVNGAYLLELGSQQVVGTEWDVRVCPQTATNTECLNNDANEQLGRLWSQRWDFDRNPTADSGYGAQYANNGSFYAIVPGGEPARDAVVELRMQGVSGYWYELAANSIGPETAMGARVGRSVPVAGHQITPEFPLYLNPPAIAGYNWLTPMITDVMLAPACGTSVVTGVAPGEISFGSNVIGQYVVICDVDEDGIYDFANPNDFSSFGDAVQGTNVISWDGTENDGDTAAEGTYNCIVRLNVGEFHYIAQDIETAYPGARMYRVNADRSRAPIPMFWDDNDVQANDLNMPNGQPSPVAPIPDGLNPGAYANAAAPFYFMGMTPTGNARAWGNNTANGKGNNAFLDTFAAADSVTSTPFQISVISGGGDADGDGLTSDRECAIGSDPENADTDGDGLEDGQEAGPSGPAQDTDNDGTPDVLDNDDDGDGVLTADEGADPNMDGDPSDAVDSDGDGTPDYLETDSDDDGVLDGEDSDPTNDTICEDSDNDTCDDCSGGNGADPANDGTGHILLKV